MYNSILDFINAILKDKELTINGGYIRFGNSMPKAFYETVIKYMKDARNSYEDDPKLDGFYIKFDKNFGAYMEFIGNKGTRVIVLKEGRQYSNLPPAKIVKEQIFLGDIAELDKEINSNILKSLSLDFKNRFLKDESQIQNINEIFSIIGIDIANYITYLDKENKFIKELREKELGTIYFDEAEASKNTSRTTKPTPSFSIDRKNDEIPLAERIKILDDFNPNKKFEARSNNSSSVYYVRVFNIKNNYKLVMEPEEGNKYTKVVYIDEEKLNEKELRKIVIDSLQLSRDEITKQPNITRHSHTTLEEYKKLIRYLILKEKDGLNHSIIKKIDEAEDYKKR